ncbi:MAG: cobalamin-independent methionine synthase II family protein [Acidimicrobiaceae bacterium]|nr:cobalamin-independent methionine synthase II family protein [Acidimicrobiaceae bacterium]
MRRSQDRILVSHAGTLPRPEALWDLRGGAEEQAAKLEELLPAAVKEVVARQAEIGIDIVNDGEIPKRGSFLSYMRTRITGFEARPELAKLHRDAGVTGRDRRDFPGFYAAGLGMFNPGRRPANPTNPLDNGPFAVTGKLTYIGQDQVEKDIARLLEACEGLDVEPYLPATAPGSIEHWLHRGDLYGNDEDFLEAIADAMAPEYQAITAAGIVLQIDDPDLPDGWQMFPDMTVEEYRKYAALRVEALNYALRDVPEELIRFHVCWGSQHGPHRDDIPLADIVDLVLSVKAQCYSIEASNPRHEHEWKVWRDVKLPEGKLLMPGVVGHSSDLIEHPELVAERLQRYAEVVGRENVIAGTDCGLGSRVHEEIAWAKLEDLAKGARLASAELWK